MLTCTFDQPLFDQSTTQLNWSGRTGAPLFQNISASLPGSVAYRTITIQTISGGFNPAEAVAHYNAAPPDVANRFLMKAPAFTDFPLTIVP